jgi:hypothetical protein
MNICLNEYKRFKSKKQAKKDKKRGKIKMIILDFFFNFKYK